VARMDEEPMSKPLRDDEIAEARYYHEKSKVGLWVVAGKEGTSLVLYPALEGADPFATFTDHKSAGFSALAHDFLPRALDEIEGLRKALEPTRAMLGCEMENPEP